MTDEEVEVVARAAVAAIRAMARAHGDYWTEPDARSAWSDEADEYVVIEGLWMGYDGQINLTDIARAAITALDAYREEKVG